MTPGSIDNWVSYLSVVNPSINTGLLVSALDICAVEGSVQVTKNAVQMYAELELLSACITEFNSKESCLESAWSSACVLEDVCYHIYS